SSDLCSSYLRLSIVNVFFKFLIEIKMCTLLLHLFQQKNLFALENKKIIYLHVLSFFKAVCFAGFSTFQFRIEGCRNFTGPVPPLLFIRVNYIQLVIILNLISPYYLCQR